MSKKEYGSLTASMIAIAHSGLDRLYKVLADPPEWLSNARSSLRRGSIKPGRPWGSGLIEEDEALLDRVEFLCGTENIEFSAAIERVADEEVIDDVTGNKRDNLTRRLRRKWRIRHPDRISP